MTNKVISVSGSQGQGKSTTLKGLAFLSDERVNVIPNKTARSILAELGVTLDAVNRDLELKTRFQDMVVDRHIQNITSAIQSDTQNGVFFIERSFADIFAYAAITLGPFNEYSDWLDGYYEKCKTGQDLLSGVVVLSGRTFAQIENDGVRGTNRHYSTLADMYISHLNEVMTGTELHHINTPKLDERVAELHRIASWYYMRCDNERT